jgi:hypothetical protein
MQLIPAEQFVGLAPIEDEVRMSKVWMRIGAPLGAVAAIVACGGTIAPDNSCGTLYDALVAMEQHCGIHEVTNQDVRAAFVAYCDALATVPGVKDLDAQYAKCAKNLDPDICAGPQCGQLGTLPANARCTDDAQCQSGFCIPTMRAGPKTEQMCGSCAALVGLGASCGGNTKFICGADLFCGNDGICHARPSCNGTYCKMEQFCDGQTCQPRPTKGESCATQQCVPAYACIDGVCRDRVAPGGPCPTGNECEILGMCDMSTHLCMQKGGAGAPCNGAPCADGLWCMGGSQVCEVPKALGASCVVDNFECATGLWCTAGTCELPAFSLCQ